MGEEFRTREGRLALDSTQGSSVTKLFKRDLLIRQFVLESKSAVNQRAGSKDRMQIIFKDDNKHLLSLSIPSNI